MERGNERRIVKEGKVLKRINVEEIEGRMRIMDGKKEEGILKIKENEKEKKKDVVEYEEEIMGVKNKKEMKYEEEEMKKMERYLYGEKKRV